ncbi:MAG: extracellular solute-binding protein [Proteobacteria bacterium]|nr:extracellular solute-binding protein [Pseudomonadota bacterium]MBI3499315.1 extracellular solute-binding protein [Pseudomonadota bacterium]
MRMLFGLAAAGAFALTTSGAALAQGTVTVWWNKGFYEAEDTALLKTIAAWEQKNPGSKIDLTLIPLNDMLTKTVSAIEAKNVPDVGFGWVYDFQASASWAKQGLLEDVGDIVTPYKEKFLPNVLPSVTMAGKDGKRAVYAVPIHMQTMHFHYWNDMLEDAGFKEADIPKDWNQFWDFWCDKVQGALRKKGQRTFGVGLPMSTEATDTFYIFYTFLGAYGVRWIDENGKLMIADPKVREGYVKALTQYTSVFKRGCTPPGSVSWGDADNNNNLHNRTTVATPNPSVSIPGKHLDDMNAALKSGKQADADISKANYYVKMHTMLLPDGPGGQKIIYPVATKQAVIFRDAKNKAGARSFLAFLLTPEQIGPYVEGSFGRWFPTSLTVANTPFWTDGKDPHRSVVFKQYTTNPLSPFPSSLNAGLVQAQNENVFGRAIGRIVIDNWSVDKAVDEMFGRLKELAG